MYAMPLDSVIQGRFVLPTTTLEAVNAMLSGIGEVPVTSLAETTNDASLAHATLAEISKAVQIDGFQWNTEDNYPLTPDRYGFINVSPSVVRVAFREPSHAELTMRGRRVYDRKAHSYIFPQSTRLLVTVTMLLPFEELPEAARRYITIRALRVFQARAVGSTVLARFEEIDEIRARTLMLMEENKQRKPNLLTGTLAPVDLWRPVSALQHRGARKGG